MLMKRLPSALCLSLALLTSGSAFSPSAFAQAAGTQPLSGPSHGAEVPARFAIVEGVEISGAQYLAALNDAIRNKFYHGQPPEAEITRVRRSVGFKLINDILLEREAKKVGVKPDASAVDEQIAAYEARYKDSPVWQERRSTVLPELKAKLTRDSIRSRMEEHIRKIPAPSKAEVKKYYEANPDKFTEPEQDHLAMILLKVDPSSTSAVWQAAMDEGNKLVERVKAGAKFAELAVLHSSDESAERGGDLGYIHRGMVPEGLHAKLDDLKIGDVSDPIRILEGVAVFQLLGRKEPKHHPLERVYDRASELLMREKADEAWQTYLDKLPSRYSVEINVDGFPAFKDAAKG